MRRAALRSRQNPCLLARSAASCSTPQSRHCSCPAAATRRGAPHRAATHCPAAAGSRAPGCASVGCSHTAAIKHLPTAAGFSTVKHVLRQRSNGMSTKQRYFPHRIDVLCELNSTRSIELTLPPPRRPMLRSASPVTGQPLRPSAAPVPTDFPASEVDTGIKLAATGFAGM